jgi:hypothetical protein
MHLCTEEKDTFYVLMCIYVQSRTVHDAFGGHWCTGEEVGFGSLLYFVHPCKD